MNIEYFNKKKSNIFESEIKRVLGQNAIERLAIKKKYFSLCHQNNCQITTKIMDNCFCAIYTYLQNRRK